MNYIYDIFLNFSEIPYDFFDWNRNDPIFHIKKIPIYKINLNDYLKIIKYNFKISNDLFNCLNSKTQIWNNSQQSFNCALFNYEDNIVGVMFDNNGNSIKKSFLLIDEELEILDEINNIKLTKVDFKINNSTKYYLKTRKEILDNNFVIDEINNMNEEKLNYIYYECFNKQEKNINKIKKRLKSLNNNSEIYNKLYNTIKLISTTNKKMI